MSEEAALKSHIEGEIARGGPIPFARFMELCLYHPRLGYYTRGLGGGGGRDYLTSSGIHEAFGLLVARQVEEMWALAGRPAPFLFVEFGPGEGHFATDFLSAPRTPDFTRALSYVMVERSPALVARQRARLEERLPVPLSWVSEKALAERGRFTGCLFANEVLDAFPVHRVVGTPEGPREVYVTSRLGRLEEVLAPLSEKAIAHHLDEAGVVLEPGQEVDLNLDASTWIARAVALLERGYVVVVDYGYEAADLYGSGRRRGTLLAYHRHRANEEYLERPGEQDLTAHLDFTALKRVAERAGARCLGLTTQARFLLALGALDVLTDFAEEAWGETDPGTLLSRIRDREALKTLILPDRMGERFRVLILAVGDVPGNLAGLAEPWVGPVSARGA
jgi:SAM-dependent MidA family methyltransferase